MCHFHTTKVVECKGAWRKEHGKDKLEIVIPYGKSKFLQRVYIFNPFKISVYKRKYQKLIRMFNCGWITDEEWENRRILFKYIFNKTQRYFHF